MGANEITEALMPRFKKTRNMERIVERMLDKLIKDGLVEQEGDKRIFKLTDAGMSMAAALEEFE